jgi:guanylate kinase
MKKRPLLITVTGPSGTGKDAVINALLAQDHNVKRFLSATTRAPRPDETHGVHYYFMTPAEFAAAEAAGEFYEVNPVYHGKRYGKLKREVDGHMGRGHDIIADIQIDGVRAFQKIMPEHILKVLIMPPSKERLEQRLTGRNPALADDGRKRLEAAALDLDHLHDPHWVFQNPDMKSAVTGEGSTYADYDVVLINDVLDHTVAELARILQQERIQRG